MDERWEQLRGHIEAMVKPMAYHGNLNVEKPWEEVISRSAYGSGMDAQWWHKRSELSCLAGGTEAGATSKAGQLDGGASMAAAIQGDAMDHTRMGRSAVAPRQFKRQARHKERSGTGLLSARTAEGANTAGTHTARRALRLTSGPAVMLRVESSGKWLCRQLQGESQTNAFVRVVPGLHRAIDDARSFPNRPQGWRPQKGKGEVKPHTF